MNKTEIIEAVAKKNPDIKKKDVEAVVNGALDAAKLALKKGDSVQIIGFGTFKVKKRAARKGRNPQTGKEIKIPASKTVGFTCGKELKDKVNNKKK